MTKDTIERAIKRGAGEQEGEHYEEIRYEGYAPGGIAVMVDCMTDNRKRTVAEVRHAFSRCGGNLGTDGSVAYLFERHTSIDVLSAPDDFYSVSDAMEKAKWVPTQAEITMQASTHITLDLDNAQKMLRLLDMLEDLDDIQQVYSNADISEEIMAKLA